MTIFLWTHPRSVSTAFERTISERGDFDILHEPFSDLFYGFEKKATAVGYEPQLDFEPSYSNIKSYISNKSKTCKKLFIKDMAYHCFDNVKNDFEWLKSFKPVFLIRHPKKSIPSNYKLNPKIINKEVGYDTLFKLYQQYLQNNIEPLIIDAADFTAHTKKTLSVFCNYCGIELNQNSLEWKKAPPKEWKAWGTWHQDAAISKGIEVKNTKYEHTIENHSTLKDFYDYHIPFYEKLIKEKQKFRAIEVKK